MPYAVAIPARNEEDHIQACLDALDGQIGASFHHVVLFANNCTDQTATVAQAFQSKSGFTLHIVEETLLPQFATAGAARARAMEFALSLAGADGILFTTDADGRVDSDWLANSLVAFEQSADVVAGWAELDPFDWGQMPIVLHENDARECAYDALCDEIHARLDPDKHDPIPRHTQHSGASIAVTARAFQACGGVPNVASGEDRALIAALRRVDARIRHDPAVRVCVSGRTEGRAAGGMAETIRRRLIKPDETLDDRLEPAMTCALRARCRALARQAYKHGKFYQGPLASALGLPLQTVMTALGKPFFGQAWALLEEASPNLKRMKVFVMDLREQMAIAAKICDQLRSTGLIPISRYVEEENHDDPI